MSVHQVNEKRRALIKSGLAAGAAMSIGIPVTSVQAASARKSEEGISWHKGVCRFCGTGCGLQVGVRDDRIIATKGDPDAPVNRGLNCVKGYFNAKIMYGRDRLTQPLMRRTNGKFDKNGKFEPVSWDEAFDEMARQFKRVYAEKGPSGVALVGSGQYTPFPRPTPPRSSGRAASAPTTSTRTPDSAWRPLSWASTRPSASTSPPTTTATSSSPTR